MNYIYIILVLVVVGLALWVVKLYKDKKESDREVGLVENEKNECVALGQGLAQYNQKLQEKKNQVKEKILELFKTKSEISNHDVAEKLNISRASAFRYLDELEKEGKLKQVGETGAKVVYRA